MAGTLWKEPVARGGTGLSGSTVKLIAVFAMIIDHIAAVVLVRQILDRGYANALLEGEGGLAQWMTANGTLYSAYTLMRMAGRLGFPIFCFLLAEGFQRTGNAGKYVLRLGVFALLSELPFDLAMAGKTVNMGYQNVFFTLFLGLISLCAFGLLEKGAGMAEGVWRILTVTGTVFPPVYFGIWLGLRFLPGSKGEIQDYLTFEKDMPVPFLVLAGILLAVTVILLALYGKKKGMQSLKILCGKMTVLILTMYLADLLRTDYAGMGVLTIAVMYALRKNRVRAVAAGCAVLTLMSFNEIFAFFTLIPVGLYNGKRGLKMKYFFYAFYPVHLLLLYLAVLALGLGKILLL